KLPFNRILLCHCISFWTKLHRVMDKTRRFEINFCKNRKFTVIFTISKNFSNKMITVNDISVQFGGTTLFSDVSFSINETDKIALMGKNGAGKSTLLKIIAGVNKPSTGNISAPKETVIAYLPQHLLTKDNATVFEETSKAFSDIFKMRDEIEDINNQLTVRTDYESDEYMKLIEKVSELSEKFYSIEEVNYEAEVEKVLKGLGFTREDF